MTSWTREKIEQAYRDGWRDFSGEDFSNLNLTEICLFEADMSGADLTRANLSGADLRRADLAWANLSGADQRRADLTRADLTGADLRRADLSEAYLSGTDLNEADLTRANLDSSCWPLWCGSLDVRVDKRIAAQLMYHVLNVMLYSDIKIPNTRDELIDFANRMHRPDVKRLER